MAKNRPLTWKPYIGVMGGARRVLQVVAVFLLVLLWVPLALVVVGLAQLAGPHRAAGIAMIVGGIVFAGIAAATLSFARGTSASGTATREQVMRGLEDWARVRGWDFLGDAGKAADAVRSFHISDQRLDAPVAMAQGQLFGMPAMVMFVSDKDPEVARFTTVCAVATSAEYPLTTATPMRVLDPVRDVVDDEIDMESADFNREWAVRSADKAGAHAIFTPLVINRLTEPIDGGVTSLTWDGPSVRSEDDAFIADPDFLDARLYLLSDVGSLTPAYQRTGKFDDRTADNFLPKAPAPKPTVGDFAGMLGGMLLFGVAGLMSQIQDSAVAVVPWIVAGAAVIAATGVISNRRDAARKRDWYAQKRAERDGTAP